MEINTYSYDRIYKFLAVLRIILVFVPQTGFIHPDEFFQSVEVLAGKILDVECSPPWEFNSTFAIRSMTIPYFTIGMTYKFLRDVNQLTNTFLSQSVLTPYTMLVVPRLVMCLFSFLVDFSLYKICDNNNEKYKTRLIILSSSYVMLVYGTRTFSNTVELILFSVLLYFVCESLTYSNILIRKKEYINYRIEQSRNIVERTKFYKLRLFMGSDSLRNCFVISTLTVFGFFNRPTFLAFAVIPVFFWMYRGIGTKCVTVLEFHSRMLVFILCSIPSFLVIILIDSFYYGYITWGEIGVLDVSINNFVFTPLNFLKYNINPENLAKHGLHPRYLHFLVNVPLLFSSLGVYAGYTSMQYVYMCLNKKFHLLPTVRSIKGLMTLSFITPVALLSIFQHQEPRFLIPVIIPLIYTHGLILLPEPDKVLVEGARAQQVYSKEKEPSYLILKIWLVTNALFAIFYGFLHQGGVYQVTEYISQDLRLTPLATEFHIVTSHIYSLPESFLLQKPSNKLYKKGKYQYSVNRRVFLYEEGSKDISSVLKQLQEIIGSNRSKHGKFKVYLVIPTSLEHSLSYEIEKKFLDLQLVETFYPHLSVEAFPDITSYCLNITASFYRQDCKVLPYEQYFLKIFKSFGLSLYDVTLKERVVETKAFYPMR